MTVNVCACTHGMDAYGAGAAIKASSLHSFVVQGFVQSGRSSPKDLHGKIAVIYSFSNTTVSALSLDTK